MGILFLVKHGLGEKKMQKNLEWDDLDLKPISNEPHLSHLNIPERPCHFFRKTLEYLPENDFA